MTTTPPVVPGVDAAQARVLLAAGSPLLDVRETNEWVAGHAPTAVHLPLSLVPQSLGSIPSGRPVLVVCRSGRRSMVAVAQLLAAGIDSLNLDGGMQGWLQSGGPLIAAPGIEPSVI